MSGRTSVSTNYIPREGERHDPEGDTLTLRPGDIVFAKVQLEKYFYNERLVAPAGRPLVFYGFTHPGKATVYGVFDAEDGARAQCHRQVRLWETPLYLLKAGFMVESVLPEQEASGVVE